MKLPSFKLVELVTAAPLGEMYWFYHDTLGLLVRQEAAQIDVYVGTTLLRIRSGQGAKYHFAFNIPENQIEDARRWVQARAELGNNGEIAEFASWNAHAVYFFDPAGNILELIARHTLDNASDRAFSPGGLLCVSEVGLVVDEVTSSASSLREGLGLPPYGAQGESFSAIGSEHALFVIVPTGRVWFGSEGVPADPGPLRVILEGVQGSIRIGECLVEGG